MGTKDSQSDETSSVVEAKVLPSANYISDTNSENAQLCGDDDLLPEERKKIKKKEKKRIVSAVSSNYEATPGIMEESGNTDLVVRKSKKGKRRSEEQEDAKEDSIKESIALATETSEVNPTHSNKKKEKWGDEDPESQTTCNGDAKVHESIVEPVLLSSGKPGLVEANDDMDLSFSKKKKKKSKPKSEEVQASEVAVLGINGVKESFNLTSASASNLDSEAGDATGERNLILEKKMKKVKHRTGEPEFQEFCSGDAISADGEASHSKKKKKKEKNHSVETEGKNCSTGDDDCPTEVLDITEQGEIQANNEIRSGRSKKRKKENNYSKETDERCSRELDGICPIEGYDCSKLDAESAEMKSVRSKKRKKEKSCSEETYDKHCREEGGGTSPIKASDCCDQVTELGVTQANDEMKFARLKKRKKEKHQNVLTDAQPQTGEYDNVPEKGESFASHGPEFVQKNPNECCTETLTEGSLREKDGDQHGVKGTNGGSYGFSWKEKKKKKKKKHCNDENTVEGREPGNVVDECHTTETNYEDNLAPLEKKKRDKKKSKGTEKQDACAKESNTEKALGMDSQAVELAMEHTEQCSDNAFGTGTQANSETSLVPSKKKKNNEKRRRKENEDQSILVEDGNLRGTLTDPSFKGDHTEHVNWNDQLARHSSESKGCRRRRKFHEKRDCWLRYPKENSAKEDLFRLYLAKDSSSEPPLSGTAPEQISEATSIYGRKDDFSLKESEEKIQKQEKQVDEVSTSSAFYMSAGVSVNIEIIPNVGYSSTGVAVGHSRKKLLILDVNGILVDIVPVVSGNYKPDFILSRKPVFKRPFMDDFLQFCFENFSVGFWSSRIRKNLNQIVNFLMGDSKRKLLFCWDQSHCTKTGFQTVENRDKPLVLKELRKLWDKLEPDLPWSKGDYNESNTLLLDDSPYKALLNPANTGIFPYSYRYTNAEDNSLGPGGDLRVYLEGLVKADNVQSFVRDNSFGQKAITESSTSWKFYERVIGQIPKGANPPHHARSHSCSSRREYPSPDDRLPPPRESRLPHEARRSRSPHPHTQPQPQPRPPPRPPPDTRYYHSLRREHLPYDDKFSRPPPMEYPVGEITQPIFPGHHQEGWHSRPHLREYSRHNTQFCHPSQRTCRLPETRQPYWDTRRYQPHPPWLYRDNRHYQPPLREYGHWDDRCRDDRRCRFDGRSEYGPRPRWH